MVQEVSPKINNGPSPPRQRKTEPSPPAASTSKPTKPRTNPPTSRHQPDPVKDKEDPKMIGPWRIGRTIGKGSSGASDFLLHSRSCSLRRKF